MMCKSPAPRRDPHRRPPADCSAPPRRRSPCRNWSPGGALVGPWWARDRCVSRCHIYRFLFRCYPIWPLQNHPEIQKIPYDTISWLFESIPKNMFAIVCQPSQSVVVKCCKIHAWNHQAECKTPDVLIVKTCKNNPSPLEAVFLSYTKNIMW